MPPQKDSGIKPGQVTKRCWNCHAHLPLHVKKCTACGYKVGELNDYGIARKPLDWKSYGVSLLSILAFCAFIWWAFFRDK